MPGATLEIQCQALAINARVKKDSKALLRQCRGAIRYCREKKLACLEVQIGLVQLQCHYLAVRSGEFSYLDVQHCVLQGSRLCERYPDTAGPYKQALVAAGRRAARGLRPAMVYTGELKNVDRKWGSYEEGHLTLCNEGHILSLATFSSCPECGRVVEANRQGDELLG